MTLDKFLNDYITLVKEDIEDQKDALTRADNFDLVRHLQGQIVGMNKSLKYLEAAIEKEQNT
jgi:hypothetical protein